MTEHEAQLKDVEDGKKKSVNAIYQRYKRWHIENHKDKRPLTFKEWLGWAQRKGIAEKYGFTQENAYFRNAPEQEEEVRETDTAGKETDVSKEMSKSGKIAGTVIISIAAIFVIGALVGGGK